MDLDTPQEEERHYLRHVATQPEKPATGPSDNQTDLNQALMGAPEKKSEVNKSTKN